MKALDTNVLVRFLTGDDTTQTAKVAAMFRAAERNGERFHVGLLVLLEMIWVLESLYKYRRDEILAAVEKMLALPLLAMESPEIIESFLYASPGAKADLSDILIGVAGKAKDCETTLTFDKKAAKEASLFRILA
jgi:predicted nucleic-acid-binding protein